MGIQTVTSYAQEKPNLYLSANDKDEDWRMTEILVAITESFIQGDDVITISSTKMNDVINYPEQMDVMQFRRIDPNTYINFVEVRDRGSKVSRNYVQEIIGKRKSTVIQECKIVSTFGFTQPAMKLAEHENIELRLFKLDRGPLGQYWFRANSTNLHLKQTRLDRCFLHAKVDDKKDEYKILVSEVPEVNEKVVLIFNENDVPDFAISIIDIFNQEIRKWKEADHVLFSQIPPDGQFHPIDKPINLVNIPSRIHVKVEEGSFGYVPVHGIKFNVSSKINAFASKLIARYDYTDPIYEKLIAQCILFIFEVGEKNYYQVFVRANFGDNSAKFGCVFFE
jgi:hypothetical protein